MSDGPRPLVACLGEDTPAWHTKMLNLALSLREFGGAMANAPMIAHAVGSAAPEFVAQLDKLDVECRVVERMDPRLPTSNKLRMLETQRDDFDVLVMLDCDVIIRGDLTAELDAQSLRAAPGGRAHLNEAAWERLYGRLDLPIPTERHLTAVTGERTYPYWNSGVLFVPRHHCAPLRATWESMIDRVFEVAADDRAIATWRKDQIPFACALASTGITVRELPLRLNLSIKDPERSQAQPAWGPPFVFHYHHAIDGEGFVGPTPDAAVADYLVDFNRHRAAYFGLSYDGTALAAPTATQRLRTLVLGNSVGWRLKKATKRLRKKLRGRSRGSRD